MDLVQQIINGRRNLERADLRGAVLIRRDLRGAVLRGADLTGADLRGADLRDADLTGADLRGADLREADLTGAELTGAELIDADLRGADLRLAVLRGADFLEADLRGADLTGAIVTGTGANLTDAQLIDAAGGLHGLGLFGADLTGANLTNVIGLIVPDPRPILTPRDATVVHREADFVPHRRAAAPRADPIVDPMVADALEIHRESAKINYSKLIEFLRDKLHGQVLPAELNYAEYIQQTMAMFISGSNESPDKKREQLRHLQRIMDDRLGRLNYETQSPNVRSSIYYVLQYVKWQPVEFRTIYVHDWIESCVSDAYYGGQLSCAAGCLERLIFALSQACTFLLSLGKNAEYEQLTGIISQNPDVLVDEYMMDWYKLHKRDTGGAFPAGTSDEAKRADLKRHLMSLLPESSALIDAKIKEIEDVIGFDEDSFSYGGGRRRKTKGRKPNKKRKSNKKRKTMRKRKS
jgi:hypothetical protein